jgi:hypothetical protein
MVEAASGWTLMEGSGVTVTEAKLEVMELHPPAAGKVMTA